LISRPEIPLAAGDFTDAANFVLLFARAEAATFNCAKGKIDSESLLVGLVAEQSGAAGKLLRNMGVTIRRLRGEYHDGTARRIIASDIERVTFNRIARRIVSHARKVSRGRGQSFVTTLHLLWAIVFSGPSAARDLLMSLVDDIDQLKRELLRSLVPASGADTPEEMALNVMVFDILSSGQYNNDAIGEAMYQAALKVPTTGTFDLSQLALSGLDVMLAAFREYSKLRFVNFDCKHVFIGILAERRSVAARTLTSMGASLVRTRRIVGELETLGIVCEPGKVLPPDVAVLLSEALTLAKVNGGNSVGAEHILWAMAQSSDPQIIVLMDRLGLEREKLCREASALCHGQVPNFSSIYSDSINVTPSGALIFGMKCEPHLAAAAQIALDEALSSHLSEVGGEFILLGLLWVPGPVANVLQACGVTIDTTRSAIREMSVIPGLRGSRVWQEPIAGPAAGEARAEPLPLPPHAHKMHSPFRQQSKHVALPLSILPPQTFMPFIRLVERLTIDERLAPVIVYWSSQAVSRLLPPGRDYGTLVRESTFVGYFSEERSDPPDEWCFLVESPQLCLVVYGQQALEAPNSEKYQCTGSMEPAIVRESFNRLLPIWQTLNLQDANRVEDYRVSLGPGGSSPNYVQVLKAGWPVVRAQFQPTIARQRPSLPSGEVQEPAFDPAVEKAFFKALEVSLQARKKLVGSEHLLVGLIETKNSRFLELLKRINVSPPAILAKVQELLS
jgi:hypothetical protein